MAFNVGALTATLGFHVDDDGAQRFDKKLRTLRGEVAKPVTAELKGDYDRRALEAYDRKLGEIRAQVKRRADFKAQLGADYNPRAFREYEAALRRNERVTEDNVRAQGRLRTAFGSVYGRGGAIFAASGGLYGLTRALGYGIKTGADFETQMARVKGVMALTGRDGERTAKQMQALAVRLGKDTKFSASEAADAMYELASAGFEANQMSKVLPGTLSLAASSGIDLASAAEISSNALRGFGLRSGEIGHVADVLSSAVNASSVEMADLQLTMKYIGPVAKLTGQTFEDMVAAVAAMGDAGVKGEQAGTALRAGLIRLVRPTKQVEEGLTALGLKASDLQGPNGLKPLPQLLGLIQQKTDGMGKAQRAAALTSIFGSEAASGMAAALEKGEKGLERTSRAFEQSDGAAKRAADTMNKTVPGAWDQFRGSVDTAITRVYEFIKVPLREFLMDAADWANRAGDSIIKFIEQMRDGTGAGGDFARELEEAWEQLKAIGKILIDVGGFLKDHTSLIKAAAAAWLAYKVQAKAAAAVTGVKALLGRGAPAAAAGGAAVTGPGAAVATAAAIGIAAYTTYKEDQKKGEDATQTIDRLNDALDRLQRLGAKGGLNQLRKQYDAIINSGKSFDEQADAINKLADSAQALGDRTGDLKAVGAEVKRARDRFREFAEDGGSDIREIRGIVRFNMSRIKDNLGDDTEAGKNALAKNFKLARKAVREAMKDGTVTVREGLAEIKRLMRRELRDVYGISPGAAFSIAEHGDIKGSAGLKAPAPGAPGVGKAGGGWIGAAGMVGQDVVPAMLAPGEAVLNRHQQAVIEGMLGGGFLNQLFSNVQKPHYMAKGGIVPVPGFPGERAASSILDEIAWVNRRFGLTLTDAYGQGHKSPGHTKYGTAADFAGSDKMMDRAVAALVRAGYLVGYDGRFGSQAWPGHGPSSAAGSNAHLHVEFGGKSGNLGAAASQIKAPRMGGRGPIAAVGQRIFDAAAGGANRMLQNAAGSALSSPVAGGGAGGSVTANKRTARRLLGSFGWGAGQFPPLDRLWTGESGWNENAVNPSSGAGGIPQALPASKMGPGWQGNPLQQIRWGLGYIKGRYGSPAAAYSAWLSRSPHWYGRGGRVQRFDKGGFAGLSPVMSGITNPRIGGFSGAGKNPYAIGKLKRRGRDRIGAYDAVVGELDQLASDFEYKDRKYGQSEEVLIRDDGSIDEAAIAKRADELQKLADIRRAMVAKLEKALTIARRVRNTYEEIVKRLRRSLGWTRGKKDRKGIKAQIGEYEGLVTEWQGTVTEKRNERRLAKLDLSDVMNERAEVLGTQPQPADASGGDTGGTDTETTGAPTPEDIAKGVAEQIASFNAARSTLFSQFGSNFTLAGGALVPGSVAGQAAGMRNFGALTSGAGGGQMGGAGGVTRIIEQTNIFPTPPPEPHLFARLTLHDLQAAP